MDDEGMKALAKARRERLAEIKRVRDAARAAALGMLSFYAPAAASYASRGPALREKAIDAFVEAVAAFTIALIDDRNDKREEDEAVAADELLGEVMAMESPG